MLGRQQWFECRCSRQPYPSLGSNLILKERSNRAPNFEAVNVRFLGEKTPIPVPTVVKDWEESDRSYFLLTERIPGAPLSSLWADMTMDEKENSQTDCQLLNVTSQVVLEQNAVP